MKRTPFLLLVLFVLILGALAADAGPAAAEVAATPTQESADVQAEGPEKWGIEIVGIRLTGAGHFLDFRYRVVDPEKSKALLDRNTSVYLVHQESGTRLEVPVTKVGPIRQTTRQPEKGRTYVVLFGNPGNIVKQGHRVTVVMGRFQAENLKVR